MGNDICRLRKIVEMYIKIDYECDAGDCGGAVKQARIDSPCGLYVRRGYLYIADTKSHAISRMYVPRW